MPFTNNPQYALGRTTTLTVTPCTVAADGTITEVTGSAQTITARLKGVGFEYTPTTEEISPITSMMENDVIISKRNGFDIEELVPATGISGLLLIGVGWDLVKVVDTLGSTPKGFTHYGPIVGLGRPIRSKGSVTVSMRVGQSAGNDTNPLYA